MDIKKVMYDLYDEFVAQGAWMGHAYGFENMREYYEQMTAYMKENGLDATQVEAAYQAVVQEFEAVSKDENRSFMDPDDTNDLEWLDAKFLDVLAHSAQDVADKLGIQDIRFVLDEEFKLTIASKCQAESVVIKTTEPLTEKELVREIDRQNAILEACDMNYFIKDIMIALMKAHPGWSWRFVN